MSQMNFTDKDLSLILMLLEDRTDRCRSKQEDPDDQPEYWKAEQSRAQDLINKIHDRPEETTPKETK